MCEDLEAIKKAAERAASLTRQLLAFSRKQVLQPRVLDLNEVVTNAKKTLQRLIGADSDLVAILDPSLGRVRVDPGQIEHILLNLAVNARDAMPRGGKLTIETANADLKEPDDHGTFVVPAGRYLSLSVSDTGSGMDRNDGRPFIIRARKG